MRPLPAGIVGIVLRNSYTESDIATILSEWHRLSLMLNRVTRAMGRADLHPFTIPMPVTAELGCVYAVIRSGAPSVGST
ncbi:putative zinc-binding metallopeptidase [Nocardia sp. NBC_00403]|uniref:putative zinc-binding metallopeptidase n=1 Tax=Nocardia sp. NBC_00403 TaxID=2975990 RepID=UPI002E1BE89B